MKKEAFILIAIFLLVLNCFVNAQTETNRAKLYEIAENSRTKAAIEKEAAIEFAKKNNLEIRKVLEDGTEIELISIRNGMPLYYATTNLSAAQTTRTDKLWENGGLSLTLDGAGYSKLAEWDAGAVRVSHQEFMNTGASRVTQSDDATTLSSHATHVAGTLVAHGITANAKGMAYNGSLKAFDWNDDNSEMATAAANGLEISNHSYVYLSGWHYDGTDWIWYGYGTPVNGVRENWYFGFYDTVAANKDEIAYNAPNYLIVQAAGNDRGQGPDYASLTEDYPEKDGGLDGFDCIVHSGIAKNVLTVGAVYGVEDYTSAADVVMTSFSCWGPADDGRIKPDIVAKGVSLYSTTATSDGSYGTNTGTSMASPNVTGTLALLQQHYQNLNGGTPMRSATLKSLIIHTADEAGDNIGPDYKFGWGLLNAESAAEKISDDFNEQNLIDEINLLNGESYSRDVFVTGESSLRVTIAWTDVKGVPVELSLNPSDIMLVNDLDIKITDSENNSFYPYKLDRDNPSNAATNSSKNSVDNVEMVFVENPDPGYYNISVIHDGDLSGASQPFSIIISGISEVTEITWTGETSSDWADASNWDNGVPQINNNVIIPSGLTNYPTISDSRKCNDITIEDGASLIGSENLSVCGESSMQRTINGYTSNENGWHLLSSPVDNMAITGSDFEPGTVSPNLDDFYSWDELNYIWKNQKVPENGISNFVNGTGYLVSYETGETKFFRGNYNNSDIAFSNLSKTTDKGEGWHLVGNPFQSALQWTTNDWNRVNIGSAAKIMNSGGTYQDIVADAIEIIPANQGFFIEATVDNSNSFTIPKSQRVHNATNFYKEEIPNFLTLKAINGIYYQESWIQFMDGATNSYDSQFDVIFMSGMDEAPKLYTVCDDAYLSTNRVPIPEKNISIPVGFSFMSESEITIEASGMSSFDSDYIILLEDLSEDKVIDLGQNSSYTFKTEPDFDTQRFFLHFEKTTEINEIDCDCGFEIITFNNNLYIENPYSISADVIIYNTLGEVVKRLKIDENKKSSFQLDIKKGYYVVKVKNCKAVITKKIYL